MRNHTLVVKIETLTDGWQPVGWIPNNEGFLLWCAMRDGSINPLCVQRNQQGMHIISENAFPNVLGWKERNK